MFSVHQFPYSHSHSLTLPLVCYSLAIHTMTPANWNYKGSAVEKNIKVLLVVFKHIFNSSTIQPEPQSAAYNTKIANGWFVSRSMGNLQNMGPSAKFLDPRGYFCSNKVLRQVAPLPATTFKPCLVQEGQRAWAGKEDNAIDQQSDPDQLKRTS